MNEILKKDITIKALSVLFAILLWLFVLNNIDNPFQHTTFTVPVKIQNENVLAERGLGIRNKSYLKYIEVEVKGRRDRIATVTANDLEAYIDFSSIKDAGRKELEVGVLSHKEGVQVGDVKTKTISIDIDKIVTKSFKVELASVGRTKESYKIIRMAAAPEMVSIEGLESVIDSIGSVKASIDINNVSKSMVVRKECKVYNKNDEEITGLNKNLEIEVSIEVAKEVPVAVLVKGKPAADFVEVGHKLSADKVWITGLPEVLESIVELNAEPVSIDNLTKSADIKTSIRLPEGVKLVDASKEITVTVTIEPLARKEFTIKKEDLIVWNMDENTFKYEIVPASITVNIKGKQKDLNVLDPYSLRPTIDLAPLGEGTHKVPLKLTLNNTELKVVEEYTVEVKISKK